MHPSYTNAPHAAFSPSFTGPGRRYGYRHNLNYMRSVGFGPRRAGIGGLLKVALVGTGVYFVCKKIYHAGAQSSRGQASQ
ncbi:uncharacterized protein DSM5745_06101 [Aspergillus mulundensis]|uniref:Uncharacterized protein n=1 Tax=Aspergillus mulundensis TaxID=1810919 RepID=A0A3D8RYX1_9EURO|nr:hypothetical protein DSM5745_06101 [Aspergillus mulundensis]RDW79249.1 hypothetical protein DSM5745_06101 [Aspergillus mulundensis]